MAKLKLQWKIFGFLLGFCMLLLTILWCFQTVFLSDMYKMVRTHEIKQAIALVEENIESEALDSVLSELLLTKEITVRPTNEFRPPARPIPERMGMRQPETITMEHEFVLSDKSTISLTFYAMVTPVDATVSTLRIQLVFITTIMILLAIVLAGMISKHIATPIVRINESAKGLAFGNYDTRFNGQGFLEIEELSDTLNTAATELSKVDRLRRELIANISHDLRTPLALIYSYAEMMHDFPTEITPQQTQIIMDETKRLTSLVGDVLDISKLESGADLANRNVYSLTESLKNSVSRMNELVKSDGYQLDFQYDQNVFVDADEVKIGQAFYNLLLNAITHNKSDYSIIIRQIVAENYVRIEMIDHGDGIMPEDLAAIWDRYYKVDKNHKRPIMGTGLGLSIVKRIIEMHDGRYGVRSTPGQGSCFWFELPIYQ